MRKRERTGERRQNRRDVGGIPKILKLGEVPRLKISKLGKPPGSQVKERIQKRR